MPRGIRTGRDIGFGCGGLHAACRSEYNPGLAVDPRVIVRWQFEPGAITEDTGTVGTNDLGNVGVAQYTADRREGKGCADFELSEGDYMGIAGVNQSAGFPLKWATGNKKLTICVWLKPETVPAPGSYSFIVSKQQAGYYCFDLTIQNTAGVRYLRHCIGYNGGASAEVKTYAVPFDAGHWWHVAYSFDDATKAYHVRVYERNGANIYDTTGFFTNNIFLTDVPFTLGVFHGMPDQSWYDGLMDEFVLFNEVLSTPDIDLVRRGKYTY